MGLNLQYNVNIIECYGYVEERTGGGRESFTKEMILMAGFEEWKRDGG